MIAKDPSGVLILSATRFFRQPGLRPPILDAPRGRAPPDVRRVQLAKRKLTLFRLESGPKAFPMSKNIKKLPSGAKLFFRMPKVMQPDLMIEVSRFVRERAATTLTGSIPLEDVPQFLQEVKRRHAEIIAEQKEIRRKSAGK
jgi:hypothetical protein